MEHNSVSLRDTEFPVAGTTIEWKSFKDCIVFVSTSHLLGTFIEHQPPRIPHPSLLRVVPISDEPTPTLKRLCGAH
jgi:hypothetical protein